MDSYYIDRSDEDSRQSRSRSNSHLSTTTSQFQELNIKSSANASHEEGGTSTKGPTSTTSFLNPDPLPSSTFISSPAPQQLTPFPDFSQAELDANWLFAEPEDTTGPTPIVRLDPVQHTPSEHSLGGHPSISRSNSFPANMSTIGIQNFDPRFDSGIQQSYTWPRFDLGDQFLPQQMSPPMAAGTLTPGYDPKLMPMYARSISSSPPRPNLTPEQRELKRQRDVARRDSKVRMRRDRSTSNPYTLSPHPSPEMLSRSLSEFSNGLTPSPLLSQGSQGSPNMSNISSPAYLSGYTPGLTDPSSDLYGQPFTMAPDFSGMPAYSMPFPSGPMDSGLQTFMPRPHSLSAGSEQQPNMQHMQSIYQNTSPKMGSDSADGVRVVHSRPKPQCWEHGCNGRQFSTFSNLLRHQREKSGAAAKSTCPNCGAEFTRTTARNGHMAHEKCKQRRTS